MSALKSVSTPPALKAGAGLLDFFTNLVDLDNWGITFLTGGFVLYLLVQILGHWSGIRGTTGALYNGTSSDVNLNSSGILAVINDTLSIVDTLLSLAVVYMAARLVASAGRAAALTPRALLPVLTMVIVAYGVRILIDGMGIIGAGAYAPRGVLVGTTATYEGTGLTIATTGYTVGPRTLTCTASDGSLTFPLADYANIDTSSPYTSGASRAGSLMVCGFWPLLQNAIYVIATRITDKSLDVMTLILGLVLAV